jgi:hypothetical protein
MSHAARIAEGIQVGPLLEELAAAPHLWDQHPMRKDFEGSPFSGTSDIWLRYADPAKPEEFNKPHFPVWYPAAEELPSARVLAHGLQALLNAEHLGGVLISRIPAGGEVKPHTDKGPWHPEFYNTKVYIVLQGNEACINHFDYETYVMRTGEAWLFNNLVEHSVVNNGGTDRVSLIVCLRKDN